MKPSLRKAVHKEADAGSRGADHLRQGFLRNGRNEVFRFTRLAEFRHQQENPRQAFFAGVEELIHKIGLGPHAAGQQELQERSANAGSSCITRIISLPSDLERRAGVYGSGRGQAQSRHRREGLLSNEVAGGEKRDCGLFAVLRNDGSLARPL